MKARRKRVAAAQPADPPAAFTGPTAEMIDQVRDTMTRSLPGSATALAEKAREGSVPHIKLMVEMLGLDKGAFVPVEARPQEKKLEEILMEQWNQLP